MMSVQISNLYSVFFNCVILIAGLIAIAKIPFFSTKLNSKKKKGKLFLKNGLIAKYGFSAVSALAAFFSNITGIYFSIVFAVARIAGYVGIVCLVLGAVFLFQGSKSEADEENAKNENVQDGARAEEESAEAYCSLGKHIVLCLFTFGIWYLIWTYRTTKFLNKAPGAQQYNPTNQLLLCMFVPFYQIFWLYKHGQRLDTMSKQKNLNNSDMATLCLILGIFVPIVACILMQDRINILCTTKAVAEEKKADSVTDELKKFKELLDSGVITQEEFDAKKKELLGL